MPYKGAGMSAVYGGINECSIREKEWVPYKGAGMSAVYGGRNECSIRGQELVSGIDKMAGCLYV
jgi:hypothetical protein